MAEAPLPRELWQHLAQASTATVTTQLFKRGLRRMHLQGVLPVSRGRRLAGEALTLRYIRPGNVSLKWRSSRIPSSSSARRSS